MERLKKLYLQHFGRPVDTIIALRSDGSERKIYRLLAGDHTVIGIIGVDHQENAAFLEFSRHFYKFGLRVPEIYIDNLDEGVYLEEDLGDETLFSWMTKIRQQSGFNDTIKAMYRQAVAYLPHFQIEAGQSLDYSYCYQHQEFGMDSMQWDVHYFKHRFLNYFYKRKIDHTNLEKDFSQLIKFLLQEDRQYFLYRDFQSRNIMIKNNLPHFIDYQSGRKGALQYDLASLLFDAKANVPQDFREELVDVYLENASRITRLNARRFNKYFYGFVLIRMMQAFGAYGYLSAVKGKKEFLKSIPFAINNLEILFNKKIAILDQLPTLRQIFSNLIEDRSLRQSPDESKLTVTINSFGYQKSGIPPDTSGNHGGFVFDCRCLPNPGREAQFANLSGKSQEVIAYLEQYDEVDRFMAHAQAMVEAAIANYLQRGFNHLQVSFGCTGGLHRSVYCAERLYQHLKKHPIELVVHHIELEKQQGQ
ncbi:MAG: phosphotransferase [candidate division KSB1 bacterium]|nr:phosphotransferase [candidate division KSB1 bacterium]